MRPACRRLSEQDGSLERRAACHQRYLVDRRSRSLGGICRLRNARILRFFMRGAPEYERSPGEMGALGIDDLAGAATHIAATRAAEGLDYRATTAQWHADRAARRPKPVKLAVNLALRAYVQDRLAGVIVTPKGNSDCRAFGVFRKGRRHGPRQDRRWASAWSPEQIVRHRLRLDFPDDKDDAHQISRSHLPVALRARPWRSAPRADGLFTDRACVCAYYGRAPAVGARLSSCRRS